jgi:hypothetical protein
MTATAKVARPSGRSTTPRSKPRIVRSTVERFAPSLAELRQQCKLANRADRNDDWTRYIYWPDE